MSWTSILRRLWPGGGHREDPRDGPHDGPASRSGDTAPGAPTGSFRETECAMCGRCFREDRGQPACRSCPLARACRFVRCPFCGYENPVTPAWLRRRESTA